MGSDRKYFFSKKHKTTTVFNILFSWYFKDEYNLWQILTVSTSHVHNRLWEVLFKRSFTSSSSSNPGNRSWKEVRDVIWLLTGFVVICPKIFCESFLRFRRHLAHNWFAVPHHLVSPEMQPRYNWGTEMYVPPFSHKIDRSLKARYYGDKGCKVSGSNLILVIL